MHPDVKVYRNISFATAGAFSDLFAKGTILQTRGQEVRELRNRLTVLRRPRERCVFVPYRRPNVFVSLAETMWVLAGRCDIAWLRPYLRRVDDYSDDGMTWRGGYGPRLRDWNGVDQLASVRALLRGETAMSASLTRRWTLCGWRARIRSGPWSSSRSGLRPRLRPMPWRSGRPSGKA